MVKILTSGLLTCFLTSLIVKILTSGLLTWHYVISVPYILSFRSQIRQKRESMESSRAVFVIFCLASVFTSVISSIADGSRTEDAEQLNESLQENSGERNEQELPHNENSESWNILRNEIISSEATDVGIFDFGNEYRTGYSDGLQERMGRTYNIKGNKIDSNKGQRVGIGKFGNTYSRSKVSCTIDGLIDLVNAIYRYI